MAYKASDLFSGTWQNIPGITASWESNQNSQMRGFCVFVDGYDEEINGGKSVFYEGEYYYEWGYVLKDSDLDGILEISQEYKSLFASLVVPSHKAIIAYLFDARYSILTVVLAGFGRAISEVGAVIIVGGNIDHLTRVMTTTIALETSKGNLSLALALGIILLSIALTTNFILIRLKIRAKRRMYV